MNRQIDIDRGAERELRCCFLSIQQHDDQDVRESSCDCTESNSSSALAYSAERCRADSFKPCLPV